MPGGAAWEDPVWDSRYHSWAMWKHKLLLWWAAVLLWESRYLNSFFSFSCKCHMMGVNIYCNTVIYLFSSHPVTVQCTRDGQFVVVVARDATLPHIDVDSVSLLETNDPSCTPVDYTAAFAIFQFPVTACGTILKVASAVFVFCFS